MTDDFQCPSCHAPYKVVRVETDDKSGPTDVSCTECSCPFTAYESGHILKYFKTAPSKVRRMPRAAEQR